MTLVSIKEESVEQTVTVYYHDVVHGRATIGNLSHYSFSAKPIFISEALEVTDYTIKKVELELPIKFLEGVSELGLSEGELVNACVDEHIRLNAIHRSKELLGLI